MNLLWIGGLIGLVFGGWRGALIGAAIGYLLARVLPALLLGAARSNLREFQALFLDTSFAVMGAMAKADGRVSEDEIRAAEKLFRQMRLDAEARQAAIASFNRGKADGFDLDAEVARYAAAARGQRVLQQMFLQVQVAALAADNHLHEAEHVLLLRVARGLGLSEADLDALEAMLRPQGRGPAAAAKALEDAYRVLGVPPSASDAEIKRAYRKLMSENHPDKLAGKGLPESMREIAEQKTRAITGAYELIEKSRRAASAAG